MPHNSRESIQGQASPRPRQAIAKHQATHRTKLVERARAGDADAGRALLVHGMVAISRAVPADEADKAALDWLHEALRLTAVEGYPIDRAFGVERVRGRPRRHALADVIDAALVVPEVQEMAVKFKATGEQDPKRKAVQKVAQRLGVSASEVRRLLARGAPAKSGSPKSE